MKIKQSEMDVLISIIGAVETGGQIYGQRRYNDYTPAGANCSNEISCTIGAFQEYNSLAKGLLQEILNTYPDIFRKYDNAGIEQDLKRSTWNGYSPERGSKKAKAISAIIDSPNGRKVQDARISRQMVDYIAFAEKQGVTSVDALFMCANFIHQGGYSACTRILSKTPKPYTLDNIYKACQSDTGNQVGAYRTRQSKVYGWLKQYLNKQEGGNVPMSNVSINQAIDALIACAENEVGYLEKRSNSQLDSKTGNAGTANYTKYWRDLKVSYQGQPWCAVFVSWIMYKTFGLETAKKLLKHTSDFPYVYCPTLGARFTKHANPQRGDIVIFYRNGTFAHTGIVTKVQGDRFWTVEGNTSGGSTIIANGGGVCAKSYYNSNLPGTKFCRPDYSIVKSINSPSSTPQVDEPNLITKPLNKTVKFTGTVTASSLNVRLQPSTEAGTCSFSPLKKNTVINVHDSVNDWYYISYNGKYGFVSAQYISKDTSQKPQNVPQKPPKPSSDKWVGCVYKPSTNVYKAPTGVNPLMEYPKLKNGNLVDVVGEEGGRYKVVISGKYAGYVNKSDIKDSKKEFPYLANVNTNGSTLNLRESPVSGNVIVAMPNGSNVIVRKKSNTNGWFEIRYKKQVGYASGDYLKKA